MTEQSQVKETDIVIRPFSIVLQKMELKTVKSFVIFAKCNMNQRDHEENSKLFDMRPFSITLPKFNADKHIYSGPKVRAKDGSMRWNCDRCEDSFKCRDKYAAHRKYVHFIKMVLPDGRAKCDKCHTICDSLQKLCRHRQDVCEKRRNPISSNPTCPICGIRFKDHYYIGQHLKEIHLKLKPHQCDRCDMAFARNTTLENHINAVHYRIRNFKCDECDFSSNFRSTLTRHIREVHNHNKPHSCPTCHKLFTRKLSLERHFDSVHSKLKIHPCLICLKMFKSMDYAKIHMRKFHSYVRDIRGVGTWLEDQLQGSEEE
jgi:uncharacterized C2H2 Zn-finger protein